MSHRYAVLWSLEDPTSLPIGVAVEQEGHVLVDVPEHLCVPARHRGEYQVLQPDSTHLTYRPGDDGYFDQVLVDLSRMFAIGERGEILEADPTTVVGLLRTKVFQPLESKRVKIYANEHKPRYVYAPAPPPSEQPEQPALTSRARRELVGV